MRPVVESVPARAVEARRRSWVVQLPLLFVVLLGASAWVGFDGYFFIDESALYGQVELVNDGRWLEPLPVAEVDPTNEANPMARSYIADGAFAPFGKHPGHVLIAAAADRLGGAVGIRVLSVLAAVVAAGAAGALAARIDPAAAVAAVWTTGLASPLVFHSNLVVAHTLGAAVAGIAVVLLLRSPSSATLVALIGLGALGSLLRSEFVLFGAAVAIGVAVGRWLWASTIDVRGGATFAAGSAAGYVLEPQLTEALLGGDDTPYSISSSSRGGIEGLIDGLGRSLVDPGYSPGIATGDALLVAAVVAMIAACLLLVRRRDAGLAALVALGGVVFAALRLDDPALTPALTWAFPAALVAAALVVVGAARIEPIGRALLVALGVFGGMVAVTQYSNAGAVEWGWRFVAVAMPVLSAVVAVILVQAARPLPRRPTVVFVAAVATVSLLVPLSGLRQQRETISATNRLLVDVDRQFDDAGASFIVTTDASIGRFAWRPSTRGDLAEIDDHNAATILEYLATAGHETMLYVFVGEAPEADVTTAPFQVVTDPRSLGGTAYRFVVLER